MTDAHDDDLGRSLLGWWPDPTGRHEHRYHNGTSWTADVADGGDRFIDPHGAGPGPVRSGLAPTSPSSTRNPAATTSLVFGVAAAALGLVPFVFVVAAVAAVVALVLGVIGLRRSRALGVGRSRAVGGLVTGGLGLVAAIGGGVLTVLLLDAVGRYEDPGEFEVGEVTCTVDDGAWVAEGSITNLDDETRDYTVTVEFRRAGTDNAAARTRLELDDVEPGDAATFRVRRTVELDDVDCAVGDVDGPAPFGIDLGG